ncbi:MAG: ferritin-like domain-containing protein [Selenomonadales bacterium]|nr:ferritin-like domain-containing protein [Selenomonadales bacterium]
MITQKELMLLDDFLAHVQTTKDILNHVAAELTDTQAKQLCQQFAQREQQHFQTMSKHLNAGSKMQ